MTSSSLTRLEGKDMQDPLQAREQQNQIPNLELQEKETEELPKGTTESLAETEEHPKLRRVRAKASDQTREMKRP